MSKINISFNKIGRQLFSYIESLYQPNGRFPYPLQIGQRGTFLGSLFAFYIALMLNRENDLLGFHKIMNEITKCIDHQTGLIIDPYLSSDSFLRPGEHSKYYVTLQSTYFGYIALYAAGKDIKPQLANLISYLESIFQNKTIPDMLNKLDWKNPWLVSNIDMFIGGLLLLSLKIGHNSQWVAGGIEEYFQWHDRNQDSRTGFWGFQNNMLNAMAGAYHIILNYSFVGRTINFAHRIIDNTLSLVQRDGLFVYGGGGGSCEDMDAIDILVRLSLQTGHRTEQIKDVLLKASTMIALGQNKDGGFSWRIQPHPRQMFRAKRLSPNSGTVYRDILLNILHLIRNRSHYRATHYYSSLSIYPFKIMLSDTWSSWFRPLALAFIAKRFPESFSEKCNWRMPKWPGLGFDPFYESPMCKN